MRLTRMNLLSFKMFVKNCGGGILTTHSKSRDKEEILKENFELTDVWRVLNPDATRFKVL